ncbi:MAG: nucleoside kinase [Clostridia bacterium]|nr:nucleoside kinase [Clostridia bacterium]
MKVKYNDKEYECKKGTKISELLKNEIEQNKYTVVGAKLNNEYQFLDEEILENGKLELVDISMKEGTKIYRRTLIYIMGMAFQEVEPKALLTVDYQLANEMFCEIDNMEVTKEMIAKVKEKMQEIINKNLTIEKRVMTRKQAEKFFEETGTVRGKLQLDLKSNDKIKMYYCEDYYNYCYGNLANRTGSIEAFDLVKYGKGFLVRYPSTSSKGKVPKHIKSSKLAWALDEYKQIYKVLSIHTVPKLNKAIKEGYEKEIVMLSEALHEKNIAKIADKIAKNKDIKIVLIAGPSSSGKTTFAKRLGIQLVLNGIKPAMISVDDYFVERKDTPLDENGEYDFDCLEAVDLKLFNTHLKQLLKGEEVDMPEFDFIEGTKRYKGKKMKLKEDEILIIEGIHCLNEELTKHIPAHKKYKIYTSALTVLNMDYYNRISTTDTRLVRRIVRDYNFRGYSAKNTLSTWHKVNKGEEKNIFPYQEEADTIFNTSLIYELSALKPHVMPLLEAIGKDEPEYAEAKRLINMLQYFEPIPKEDVPSNSLLREFIGGGNFKY